MKNPIFLILYLLSSMHLFSQCISVELSILWKREPLPFSLNENDFCAPHLQITYRNNSGDALYFHKVSHSAKNFPEFVRGEIIDNHNPTQNGYYSKMQFSVNLGASPNYLNGWEVIPDTLDLYQEHEISIINDDLANIYNILSKRSSDLSNEVKTHYKITDILPEVIFDNYKDKFVFLRPGEIHVNTYNLVGFKLLKGCYTFTLSPYLPEYVYTTPIMNYDKSEYKGIKILLPKVVGEYKLYSGNFITNDITITF